ncbi:MAG: hypothetical protein HQK50_03935 [Oligoflexia bacterium]|nr:hypothetical protein [Oligoflexia bacterium]
MGKEKNDYSEFSVKVTQAIAERKHKKALQLIDDLISGPDADESIYFQKCEVLFMLGRISEAVALITKFGQYQENVIYTFFRCSKYFEQQGKMMEAAYWWGKYQDRVYGRENYSVIENIKNNPTIIPGSIYA